MITDYEGACDAMEAELKRKAAELTRALARLDAAPLSDDVLRLRRSVRSELSAINSCLSPSRAQEAQA